MSRHQLHANKLTAFAHWLAEQGWIEFPVRGDYEVLRMKREVRGEGWLIVHRRLTVDVRPGHEHGHLTLHGESERWFQKWMATRRSA